MRKQRPFYRILLPCISAVLMAIGCVACDPQIDTRPNAVLRFSCDTLRFDTVFTQTNSPTLQFKVYNPQKHAVNIEQIRLRDGEYFRLNVDGETNADNLQNITLLGKDSLYVFIKTRIDEQHTSSPVFTEDEVCFLTNGNLQKVVLEAYGQDVERLSKFAVLQDTVLGGDKPYLIYDYLVVDTACTLTLKEGTTIYMHDNASLIVYGNLLAEGSLEQPIRIQGDRLDYLYTHVPYKVVSGKWNGVYLLQPEKESPCTHKFNNVEIISGKVGLYCSSADKNVAPHISIDNSRIHNFSQYGVVLQNADATICNTEISNCAQYCLYLAGGEYTLLHNTIASYYRNTNIGNIQPVQREDVAAVYLNNLSKDNRPTVCKMYNNIITGIRKNNFVLATPLPQRYAGEFAGNYIRNDSIHLDCFNDNVYAADKDTVFVRTFYSIDDFCYYDFHLDSISPARGAALSTFSAALPYDREGNPRPAEGADIGCYQYVKKD